ncbi:MAG TPA: DnaA N-terminal domain-containing protein, partial [Acidimicrobiales bacterium]|nr:DnaA N-terminal domain-containing protein [Acidimicrobiales bacterium]
MNDTNDLWKRCGDVLRDRMSDATWRTWFQGLVPQDFDGDLLVLSAPNTVVRERVESRYLELIAAAATEATARE